MKVSIVMPAYNSGSYISKSIESILCQDYQNWELVIVNDGSTDFLEEIVKSYLVDKRVILINQKNSGVASARNTGISHSSGEFIAFLDADDLWPKNKLSTYIEAFNKSSDPKLGLIYSRYYCFYKDPLEKKLAVDYPRFSQSDYKSIIVLNYIATLTVMIKKSVLDDIGLFDEALYGTEDWDLWIRVLEKYNISQLKEPLGFYRIHSLGISKNKDKHISQERLVLNKYISSNEMKPYAKVAYFSLDIKELLYNIKVRGVVFSFKRFINAKHYSNLSVLGLIYIIRISFVRLLWKRY